MTTQEMIEVEARPYLKRNIVTSYMDGIMNAVAGAMIPMQTVVVYFISGYVSSNFLIGLLGSIQLLMTMVPQFFVARKLEGKGYYKTYLAKYLLPGRSTSLILGLLILFLAPKNKLLFVILFYLVYWINGYFTGGLSLIWFNYINKVIPSSFRGKFFGLRGTVLGIGGIIGSVIGGVILSAGVAPERYAYIFLIVYVLDMISSAFQLSSYEPKLQMPGSSATDNKKYKDKLMMILKGDMNLVRYIILEALVVFALSTLSFETIYAKQSYHIDNQMLSIMTTIMYISQTIGYVIVGFIADRYGFKRGMMLGYSLYIINLLLALFVKHAYVIYFLTAIWGFAQSAYITGGRNFLFSICTYDDRPAYLCIANMVIIPISSAAPIINGLIYDLWGFPVMCLLNMVMISAAVLLFMKVKESVQFSVSAGGNALADHNISG